MPCPEAATVVSMDGLWACVAAHGRYSLHNMADNTVPTTPLFPYSADTVPIVKRVVKVSTPLFPYSSDAFSIVRIVVQVSTPLFSHCADTAPIVRRTIKVS